MTCAIEELPRGESIALREGLAGPSVGELKLGETAPERNGAGMSDNIRSRSSSPSVFDASLASCSQERMEPRAARSLPGVRPEGRRDKDFPSESGGSGER